MNWRIIKDEFEKEMALKLRGLPDHREVPTKLKEFRAIISHELPENTPISVYRKMIKTLLGGGRIDVRVVKAKYLKSQLETEEKTLEKFQNEFGKLKELSAKWVKENLSEEKLQLEWKEHKTWLPRRYTNYKRNVPFQKIAADTLARYALIKNRKRN